MRALLLAALVSFIGGASFLLASRPKAAQDDPRVREYTEAIGYNPQLPEAYLHRGMAWERKHDLQNAIADYSVAARLSNARGARRYERRIAELRARS